MNLNIGEVLSRAVQITWRNKSYWGLVILPMLVNFVGIPLYFIPLFFLDENGSGVPVFFENPVFIVFFFIFHIVFILLTITLATYGYSALALGIVRLERGEEKTSFKQLLLDAKTYFPRMLGIMFLTTFVIGAIFSAIFGCMTLFGIVTAGIGFICVQPLFILMYPVMFILQAFMEQAQAAVVADGMGVTEALTKAWELLKTNFWRLALLSLVVYFAMSVLSGIIVAPFMIPFFFFPFFLESNNFDPTTFGLAMIGIMLILFPLMALVQGVAVTFMKSVYILVYLRLTGSPSSAVLVEATA